MKKSILFLVLAIVSMMAFTFTSCSSDDDGEISSSNINGWYKQDGNYVIFKALHINNGKLTEYFRVEADNEPDWQEWDDARQLPDHSDYYYGTNSSGSHKYEIDGDKIVLDNGRTYEIRGGKIHSENDTYRRW